jgi:hypothetical protein
MTDDGNFISRWSRRKVVARTGAKVEEPTQAQPVVPVETGTQVPQPAQGREPAPLPPLESLTPESDFAPFMKPEVDPAMKREALKTLFQDPRFNVMDGLDVYIDDYSKPDPLPVEWLAKLNQMKYLGHYIEAVEEDPAAAEKDAGALQETMPEEPLALPEGVAPVDTSSDEMQVPEVRESGVSRNGNP